MCVELFPTAKDPSWQDSQSLGNPSKTPPTWQASQSITAWFPVNAKPVERWSKVDKSRAFSSTTNEEVSSTAAKVTVANGKQKVIARTTRTHHSNRLPPDLQSLFNATASKHKILLHYYERNLFSQRPKHANVYPHYPQTSVQKHGCTKRPIRCHLFFFCNI